MWVLGYRAKGFRYQPCFKTFRDELFGELKQLLGSVRTNHAEPPCFQPLPGRFKGKVDHRDSVDGTGRESSQVSPVGHGLLPVGWTIDLNRQASLCLMSQTVSS